MADKNFGVKQLDLINSSGTPNITSPNNLNLNAVTVAISTDVTVGGQVVSNVIVGTGYSVGIGSTQPGSTVSVSGDVRVGINTSQGLILTSANGTRYRLIVDNSGILSTVSI
jgi:Zn-dependent alcohol dehydrogenase